MIGVPKDAAPTAAVATPSLAAGAEEGEIVVGETLLSLKGGDFPGVVSALPSDREADALEGLGFDEAGKLRFLGFDSSWFVCDLKGSFFYFLRSCVCVDEATFVIDAWAWPDRDSPPREG